jgi:hypothetical protein
MAESAQGKTVNLGLKNNGEAGRIKPALPQCHYIQDVMTTQLLWHTVIIQFSQIAFT